ncbi:MAG: TonB family protein [Phenylobacterium sp.]|uniref:TonB family protein n=1 Tax=Phenylobacterium sp. TaxID=1871053 RepID=UPI00391A5541
MAAVVFRPLPGAEKSLQRLGPAGPFYPEKAVRYRKDGQAVIACFVSDGGELQRCKIVSESPKGFFFGEAALALARNRRILAEAPHEAGRAQQFVVPFERAK